jgi:hypothetical protein
MTDHKLSKLLPALGSKITDERSPHAVGQGVRDLQTDLVTRVSELHLSTEHGPEVTQRPCVARDVFSQVVRYWPAREVASEG